MFNYNFKRFLIFLIITWAIMLTIGYIIGWKHTVHGSDAWADKKSGTIYVSDQFGNTNWYYGGEGNGVVSE